MPQFCNQPGAYSWFWNDSCTAFHIQKSRKSWRWGFRWTQMYSYGNCHHDFSLGPLQLFWDVKVDTCRHTRRYKRMMEGKP